MTAAGVGSHNEQMWRRRLVPPTWLRRWADPALALALAAVAVWLAVRSGTSLSFGDDTGDDAPDDVTRGVTAVEREPAEPDRTLVAVAGGLLLTLPLAWRRRWPLAVFAIQFVSGTTLETSAWTTFVALLIGAYSLAAHGRWPLLSFGVLLAAGAVVTVVFGEVTPPIPDWATAAAILLPVGLVGITIRALRARAAASAERAEALHHGQLAATEAAVAEERARIAHELHDVVSHHVSVMVIQAGAASQVLEHQPEQARGALEAIRGSGNEAMRELRHLLGLLTPDGPDGEALRPQPGLAQLDQLVAKVRAAGQPVTVRHTPVDLPRGADLAAYRVVQEGLTNALRHAPGAPTTVVIESAAGGVLVEVTDEGAAGAGTPNGTGSGLLGLAERLRLYGGTLETGRRIGGGFRVRALIPAADSAADSA
jgi:signal transduction histidine kinase